MSELVSECIYADYFHFYSSSRLCECECAAYVLQFRKSIVALLPCSIHFQCVMK